MNYKQFVQFVNNEFNRLEINDFIAVKAERTYHRSCDYEAGACKMLVWFKPLNETSKYPIKHYFMCDYFLKEYNQYLKTGHKLYLTMRHGTRIETISNLEVRIKPL